VSVRESCMAYSEMGGIYFVLVVGWVQGKYTQVCSYERIHPSWLTSYGPTGREELHYNAMNPCDVSQLRCLHLYEHTCVYLPWDWLDDDEGSWLICSK